MAIQRHAGLSRERLARLERLLAEEVACGALVGAVLGVARHGVALPAHCVGRVRPEATAPAVTAETLFLVASVTKPMTAAAVMLLVERGLLGLDDPVCAVVPEFRGRDKERVRIRHLLTHTSGLPDMLPEDRALRRRNAPLAEFVERICALGLDFAPGERIQYQSMGFALLGEVVARVSGCALPEFLRRELFAPLGMGDTALGLPDEWRERAAWVDVSRQRQEPHWDWNSPYWRGLGAPWGGAHATVGDLLRWCQAFVDGGRGVLTPATVAAMCRDQTSGLAAIPAPLRAQQVWGLGWRLNSAAGGGWFGDLTSSSTFGHNGATGCSVWIDPERALCCVLLTTQPEAFRTGLLGRCANVLAAAAL